MNFQIFRARKTLATLAALVRLLLRVGAHVHQHLVARVKATVLAQAALPAAVVQTVQPDDGVLLRNVTCQILQLEEHAARKGWKEKGTISGSFLARGVSAESGRTGQRHAQPG